MSSLVNKLKDRAAVAAANFSGETSETEIAVVKATSHVPGAPKEKHVVRLISFTHQSQTAAKEILKPLEKRLKEGDGVVVLKSLILLHRLVREGDNAFIYALRSVTGKFFNLSSFSDLSNTESHQLSMLAGAYARYLEERVCTTADLPNKEHLQDIRKLSSDTMRTLGRTDLFTILPLLQKEMELLLDIPITSAVSSSTGEAAFELLVLDLLTLYRSTNEGIINLLDKYFDMDLETASEGLAHYKRFADSIDGLMTWLSTAKAHSLATNIPELTDAPKKLVKTLEEYLAELKLQASNGESLAESDVKSYRRAIKASGAAGDALQSPVPGRLASPSERSSASGTGSPPPSLPSSDPKSPSQVPDLFGTPVQNPRLSGVSSVANTSQLSHGVSSTSLNLSAAGGGFDGDFSSLSLEEASASASTSHADLSDVLQPHSEADYKAKSAAILNLMDQPPAPAMGAQGMTRFRSLGNTVMAGQAMAGGMGGGMGGGGGGGYMQSSSSMSSIPQTMPVAWNGTNSGGVPNGFGPSDGFGNSMQPTMVGIPVGQQQQQQQGMMGQMGMPQQQGMQPMQMGMQPPQQQQGFQQNPNANAFNPNTNPFA